MAPPRSPHASIRTQVDIFGEEKLEDMSDEEAPVQREKPSTLSRFETEQYVNAAASLSSLDGGSMWDAAATQLTPAISTLLHRQVGLQMRRAGKPRPA